MAERLPSRGDQDDVRYEVRRGKFALLGRNGRLIRAKELLYYLYCVWKFWSKLLDGDKTALSKVDFATVRELESMAPGIFTMDREIVRTKIEEEQIFEAFSKDERHSIFRRLSVMPGLVFTLLTFFNDLKYIKSCADCLKRLVEILSKYTLLGALESNFQGPRFGDECIVQEGENLFCRYKGRSIDRLAMAY